MTPDAIQMLLQSMQGTPDSGQEQRVSALRGQQALGILGTMGGKNLAPFGQNMYKGATGEIEDIRDREDQGLDRSLKMLRGQKILNDMNLPTADWIVEADPVHGGMVAINKYDPSKVIRITTPGLAGEGGKLIDQITGKVTEGELKTGTRGGVSSQSLMDMAAIAAEDPSNATPGFFEGASRLLFFPEMWSNAIAGIEKGADRQTFAKAANTGIDSFLTEITGAAYTKEQLQSYRGRYYPQPGDLPETFQRQLNAFAEFVKFQRRNARKAWGPDQEAMLKAGLADLQKLNDAMNDKRKTETPDAGSIDDEIRQLEKDLGL